jgi:hypothetical protein
LGHKYGDEKGGRSKRAMLKPYLPFLLALILFSSFQSATAAPQIESGVTQQLGNNLAHGTTSYVVDYTYPSTAQVGTNLTIGVTLRVQQFTGIIEYITAYELTVQLFVGSQVLQSTVYGPVGFNSSSYLYPGGIWGPNNATFALTEADTGLTRGQSANASFSVILLDTVYFGVPIISYQTEPAMTGQGGSFVVQDEVTSSTTTTSTNGQASGQTIIPYALLASGAVLMAAAVFFPRGPKSSSPSQR